MSAPAAASPEAIIELQGATKRFPGVLALDRVDLAIRRGEVHVLVGQNGAGKSTLVKLLCGLYAPDEGRILLEGQPYAPRSALAAIRAGIRVVYQEFNLLPYLSAAENVYFQRLPRRAGLVDFKRLYADAEAMLREVGLDISPRTRVETLGVAQMQLLEIAKALSTQSKVLILDEPTATLTPPEIHRLFEIVARLKAKGVTILYISHRLQEVFEVGDRITVLRNGRKVETLAAPEASIPQIVRLMVGKEMGSEYPFHPEVEIGDEILRVEELRPRGAAHAVSFAVRRGELVGVAGLVGSGRTEAMRALFGADPKASGRVYRDGREVSIGRPRDAVRHGICLLTEDRKAQGLILDMPCYANVTITDLARVSRAGLLRSAAERAVTQELVTELDIKTPSVDQLVGNLSGGNQQKVVIAKWLFRQAEVLVCDEPTRGIDMGARFEIYQLLWRLAAAGKGIVLVSSDLPELMGICHRTIFEFPDAFNEVGSAAVLGVPIIFLMALAVVLVGRFVLARTVFGRMIYAIGNNEEAVRLSGHDPARYKVAAFTVCGGMVGLAPVMYMMRLNIASPILGVGFELNAIAAVVIGGTSMSGGKGSMVGTFLGASIMGVLNNGLLLLGMGDFARQMVTGLIIVVAVIIDKYRARALVRSSYVPVHAQPAAPGQAGTP